MVSQKQFFLFVRVVYHKNRKVTNTMTAMLVEERLGKERREGEKKRNKEAVLKTSHVL